MSRKLLSYTAIGLILVSTAIADVPKVAVDIAPVHSLVARVMDGVGSPKLVIPAGASPHEYSLRPSEAKSLQDADMVIWIGEDLAPWMENSIETLSKNAEVITLLKESETKLLEFRNSKSFVSLSFRRVMTSAFFDSVSIEFSIHGAKSSPIQITMSAS